MNKKQYTVLSMLPCNQINERADPVWNKTPLIKLSLDRSEHLDIVGENGKLLKKQTGKVLLTNLLPFPSQLSFLIPLVIVTAVCCCWGPEGRLLVHINGLLGYKTLKATTMRHLHDSCRSSRHTNVQYVVPFCCEDPVTPLSHYLRKQLHVRCRQDK